MHASPKTGLNTISDTRTSPWFQLVESPASSFLLSQHLVVRLTPSLDPCCPPGPRLNLNCQISADSILAPSLTHIMLYTKAFHFIFHYTLNTNEITRLVRHTVDRHPLVSEPPSCRVHHLPQAKPEGLVPPAVNPDCLQLKLIKLFTEQGVN